MMCDESNAEVRAERLLRDFAREHRADLLPIASWGDGCCGYMAEILRTELLGPARPARRVPQKAVISRKLSKQVLERDAYRCVSCGSHIDLTCDHVVPESKGGPTAFENLQTMCRSCNARKGARGG